MSEQILLLLLLCYIAYVILLAGCVDLYCFYIPVYSANISTSISNIEFCDVYNSYKYIKQRYVLLYMHKLSGNMHGSYIIVYPFRKFFSACIQS
jgi:hypothetical protein